MAKKRLKKNIKYTLLFLVIIIAILIFYKKTSIKIEFNDIKNKIVKPVEVWPKEYKLSLAAAGDGLIHKPIMEYVYNKETNEYDFKPILSLLKEELKDYDLAYYNQETVFGDNVESYSSYPTFNTPSSFGDAMVDAGFNIVSLASNHSADCKNTKDCINSSYNYWSNKDVVFDGFNNDSSKENKYNINTKNNIKYGFLNYTDTLNGRDRYLTGNEYLVDTIDFLNASNKTCSKGYTYLEAMDICYKDTNTWIEEITSLRKEVDVLIVAVHTHYNSAEYSFNPTTINKKLANYLNTLGVDIILGTYSHCVQPYDVIENNNHKTVVFYSLGNVLSNQLLLNTYNGKYHPYVGAVGLLATMDIKKTLYEDGTFTIDISNIGADLLYSYSKNYNTNYKIVPFSKMNKDYNQNYQKIYEEYKGYVTKFNTNIELKEPQSDI